MPIDEPMLVASTKAFSSGGSTEEQGPDFATVDGSSVEPGTKSCSVESNEMDVQVGRISSPSRVPNRQLFGDGLMKQPIVRSAVAQSRPGEDSVEANESGPYRAGASKHPNANCIGSTAIRSISNSGQFNETRRCSFEEEPVQQGAVCPSTSRHQEASVIGPPTLIGSWGTNDCTRFFALEGCYCSTFTSS